MSHKNKAILCRVCLRSDTAIRKKCISLFDKHKDSLICDNINAIARVSIHADDGFPSKICPDCLLELDMAVTFKEKCENSNNILLSNSSLNLSPVAQPVQNTNFKLEDVKKEEPEDIFDSTDYEIEYLEPEQLESELNLALLENQIESTKQETDIQPPNSKPSKAIDLKLECHDCGGLFKSKCKLKVHWKRVHLLEKLVCDICKRAFKSTKAYLRHVRSKNKSCLIGKQITIEGVGKQRVFHCKDCDYKTHRAKDMQSHLVTHTGERAFKCDLCPRQFTQQSSLQGHKEGSHKVYLKEITCQFCGKFLRGRNRIYRHLKRHTEEQVQCDICKKMLATKKVLVDHMKRHTGVKTFTCEICAYTFYTLSDLCNHRRMIHEKGQHVYKCEICGYTTYRTETLKKHKARHTADRVPCLVCGMFVANAEELLQHRKRHLFKTYECPYCPLKYARRDSRNKHVKSKHKFPFSNSNNLVVKKEIQPVSLSEEKDY